MEQLWAIIVHYLAALISFKNSEEKEDFFYLLNTDIIKHSLHFCMYFYCEIDFKNVVFV